MKNFTKVLIALPFLFLGEMANAQIFDVGCTSVDNPVAGTDIYDNVPVLAQYTRENFGDDILANATDTISMAIIVDGQLITTLIRNPANEFLNGAVEATGAANAIDLSTFGLTVGNIEFCVATVFGPDANSTNDTACVTVNYTGGNLQLDLGVTSITLNAPMPNTGTSDIEACQDLTDFEVTFQNFGAATVPIGTDIDFIFTIGGDSRMAFTTLAADLAPGASSTQPVTNVAIIPTLPSVAGNYDLCASTNFTGDLDPSNDEACYNFNIVLPPDPVITSVDPNAHVVGKEVTITGTGFGASAGNISFTFFGTPANPSTPVGGTTFTAIVPVGASTGITTIEVTNCGNVQSSQGPVFTVLPSDPDNVLWPLGLEEGQLEIGKVFYNEDNLNLTLFNATNADVATMSITDLSGKVIYTEQVTIKGQPTMDKVINLGNAATGVYILNVVTDASSQQTKFNVH